MRLELDEDLPPDTGDKVGVMVMSCLEWFNANGTDRLEKLIRILTRREVFSLRAVDWMVTNFSKKQRIAVLYRGMPMDVHDDYQRHLSVFNKKLFDPFARRQRLRLRYNVDATLLTTVGQLNFLRWFLERGLDEVVASKRTAIEEDMRAPPPSSADSVARGHANNVRVPAAVAFHHGPFKLDF